MAQAAAERFRNLLEIAPDPILEVDGEGCIVLANFQAEKLFGWTRSELEGQPIEMLLPERFRHGHISHRSGYSKHPVTRPMGTGLDLHAVRKDEYRVRRRYQPESRSRTRRQRRLIPPIHPIEVV